MRNRSLQILVLSPTEPFPPRSGWSTVIYNDIKGLAEKGHKITVLAITYEHPDKDDVTTDIAHVEYFYRYKAPKWRQVIKNFGQRLPYTITRNYDERIFRRASELVREGRVDVVLVEDVVMGLYASMLKGVCSVPTYLRGHNVSTAMCQRYYKSKVNPVMRYLGWRQYVKFRRYESSVVADFDGVCQLSPVDAAEIERMNPNVKNYVIPSGVDTDYFSIDTKRAREPETIIHVGSVDPITKLPAMIWFYERVLPLVRQKHPRARLELVGHVPQCSLYHADPSSLVIHGVVPDVRPFLSKGAAFIVPQFVGSGIRIKILNAMATGNAIVATSLACEGLSVTNGRNILIADDENLFAAHICSLLEDKVLREQLGREARTLVEQTYDCKHMAEQLEQSIEDAMQRHAKDDGSTDSRDPGRTRDIG